MNEFDLIKRDTVISTACNIAAENGMDVTTAEVLSKSRKQTIIIVKIMCVWYIRKELGYSLKSVGELMSRDHTTIISLCSNHEAYYNSGYWPDFMGASYKVLYDKIHNELAGSDIVKVIPVINSVNTDHKEADRLKHYLDIAHNKMRDAQDHYLRCAKNYVSYLHRSRVVGVRELKSIERELNTEQ